MNATRWCNGNTRDFGSLIGGSSPPRVAIVFIEKIEIMCRIRFTHFEPGTQINNKTDVKNMPEKRDVFFCEG